ncbi:hypothetical protein T484DRAFT_1880403, partial [Baffinella frigidus]
MSSTGVWTMMQGLPAGWNPHKELGLQPGATPAEVKVAFRGLARKHHPDKVQGSEGDDGGETFKRARKAYEILTEPASRALFDEAARAAKCREALQKKKMASSAKTQDDVRAAAQAVEAQLRARQSGDGRKREAGMRGGGMGG